MSHHEEKYRRRFNRDFRDGRRPFRRRPVTTENTDVENVSEGEVGGESGGKTNKLYNALRFLVRDVAVAIGTEKGFEYDRDRRKLFPDFVLMLNKGLNDFLTEKFVDFKNGGYCGAFAYIMAVCLKETYLVDTFVIRGFTDDLDENFDTKNIKSIYQLDSMEFPKKLEHTYYGFVLNKTMYVCDSYGIHSEVPIYDIQGKHKYNLINGYESKKLVKTDGGDTVVVDTLNGEASFCVLSNKVEKNSNILLPYEKEIFLDLCDEGRTPKNYSEVWNNTKFLDKDFGFSFR